MSAEARARMAAAQKARRAKDKQPLAGCIPRVQRLFLKPALLRSPDLSSYRCVVNWELILSPDPKGRFVLLL